SGLFRVIAPAILDLHRVVGLELAGELDQLPPGAGLVVVFRLHGGERRAFELRDDVADLETRLVRGAPGRDPFDLGADLVGLRARIGLDHHADPATVVAHHERPDARRARRARRAFRRGPGPGARAGRWHVEPVPPHV